MVNKWELVSKLNSSSYRKKVLTQLDKEIMTPTKLQNETNIKISHVSRAISELVSMGLVKCLTPNVRRSKLYTITKLGKEILKKL